MFVKGNEEYWSKKKFLDELQCKEDYNEMFGWGSWEEDWGNFNASLEYWGAQRDLMQLVPSMSTGMMN